MEVQARSSAAALDELSCGVPSIDAMNDSPSLFRFHRRIERHLATLSTMPGHLEREGAGPQIAASAGALLQCFDHDCARHLAAEERELWPAIERTLWDPTARTEFRQLRRALAAQHREVALAWQQLRRPLCAVAEGLPRRLDPIEVAEFRATFAHHIHTEEAALARHRIVTSLTSP